MAARDDVAGEGGLRLDDWQVSPGPPGVDADQHEFEFRTRFNAEPAAAGEQVLLRFGGLATITEVDLNGDRIVECESMWLEHEVDVGSLLRDDNELVIRVLPLGPRLA